MSSIGGVLKEARTKKTMTLDEVHSKIKIHPRVLQLLEEDKFEKLPSPLFVKSFLKSYAEFLEVNSEELVSAYDKVKKAEPEQLLYIKPADPAMGAGYKPFHIVAGICAAAFLLFILVGQPAKMAKSLSAKFKSAKVSAERSKKSAPAKAREEAPFKEAAPQAKKAPEPAAADWLNSVALGNFPKINRKSPLALEIKALDSVWVHITSDGVVTFQGILQKGSAETWNAKNSIEIWTGNAANMALSLNKYLLGSPGKGVVKKMLISRDGIRIIQPFER